MEKRDTVANLDDTIAIQTSYYRGGVYNSKNNNRQSERESKSQRYEESSSDKNENNSLTRGDKSTTASAYYKQGKFASRMAKHMKKPESFTAGKKPRKLTDETSSYPFSQLGAHTPQAMSNNAMYSAESAFRKQSSDDQTNSSG